MSKASKTKALIANWTVDQDPCTDAPAKVHWEDGSHATLNDYITHSLGTHALMLGEDGSMQCHMYPQVIVDVHFDRSGQTWAVSGEGIEPFALQLTDQNATDAEIIGELYLFPVVYKARIHRE
jgi:hypothetical protein